MEISKQGPTSTWPPGILVPPTSKKLCKIHMVSSPLIQCIGQRHPGTHAGLRFTGEDIEHIESSVNLISSCSGAGHILPAQQQYDELRTDIIPALVLWRGEICAPAHALMPRQQPHLLLHHTSIVSLPESHTCTVMRPHKAQTRSLKQQFRRMHTPLGGPIQLSTLAAV